MCAAVPVPAGCCPAHLDRYCSPVAPAAARPAVERRTGGRIVAA
ncbi:hypothetical protein RJC38_10855 [Staphylococcus epidermidis]|nr:hypothetical protein [Staphylococcus epidermidis]MDS3974930.1 hypothetical protein [Staphylococcus epidermidis]